MKKFCLVCAAFLLAPLTLPGAASAQLRVDRVVEILDLESRGRADFEFSNPSDGTMYLSTRVFEVPEPHLSMEMVEFTDPRAAPLLASPREFVLGPEDSRLVRVFTTAPPGEVDRVYRVRVEPRADEIEPEASGVRVVLGYELLVIQPAAERRMDIDVQRSDTQLVITNNGNSFAYFDQIHVCQDADPCANLGAHRVYAGERLELELPHGGEVRLRYSNGDLIEELTR